MDRVPGIAAAGIIEGRKAATSLRRCRAWETSSSSRTSRAWVCCRAAASLLMRQPAIRTACTADSAPNAANVLSPSNDADVAARTSPAAMTSLLI